MAADSGAGKDGAAPAGFNGSIGIEDEKMNHALLTKVLTKNQRTASKPAHPEFRPGDTIRVHVKIKEGDKERLQAFEGTFIAQHNSGMGTTITVRKVSFGQGVERIFPLHAPVVDHIEIVRTGRVRRAKLYYLRGLKGKAARLRERDVTPKTTAKPESKAS